MVITNRVPLHLDPKDPRDMVIRNAFCRIIVDSWLQRPQGGKGLQCWTLRVSIVARNMCLVIKLTEKASKHEPSGGWADELFLWHTCWWQGRKLEVEEASGTHTVWHFMPYRTESPPIGTQWGMQWQAGHPAPYAPQCLLQGNYQASHCGHLAECLVLGVEGMPLLCGVMNNIVFFHDYSICPLVICVCLCVGMHMCGDHRWTLSSPITLHLCGGISSSF